MRHPPIAAGLLSLLLGGALLLGSPSSSIAAPPITVQLNGQTYADPLISIAAGRLLVPLRAVSEALGATVAWDDATRQITVQRADRTIRLQIDSPTAYVAGQPVQLDAPPRIVQDRTVIPYRFLGESLGAQIGWDENTRTASLWSTLADTSESQHQLRTLSGYTVVTGWYDTRSLDVVRNQGHYLTDIATVSHRLRADGSLSGSVQADALAAARNQGVRPWLVVQNLDDQGTFSHQLAADFLGDGAARARFAHSVLELLAEQGYVGLELDLEDLAPARRADFTQLLQELQPALSARGFLLSAAIPAKTADQPQDAWSGAYDYGQIGQLCDRISLMTYDEHWLGGASGPLASLPWVNQVLQYATAVIPVDKLLLGVASYAYDWPLDGGPARVLNGSAAQQLALTLGGTWDEGAASPLVRYWDSAGQARVVWYEDDRSLQRKADLAMRFGLQGLNIWRLGLGSADMLSSLSPRTP